MDIQQTTNKILYTLFAISAVVILAFFLVGFNEPWEDNPTMNNPMLTDVLLWWCIILSVACFALMIWSFVKYVKEYGFNKSYLYTWGLPIVTIIIGLVVGLVNQNDHLLINNKDWCVPSENILTDTCMVSIGILIVLSIVATIYSLVLSSKQK